MPQPEVRWITLPYAPEPVPAWRGDDGFWQTPTSCRLVAPGSRTDQLIAAAGPRTCARCSGRIVDVDRAPEDDTAVCRACGDHDDPNEPLDKARASALHALRALQHLEGAEGVPEVADTVAGLICDLSSLIRDTPSEPAIPLCPACGEPGECEIAPCGDPGCLARDCERHDACESPATPEPPGRYLPLDHPRD